MLLSVLALSSLSSAMAATQVVTRTFWPDFCTGTGSGTQVPMTSIRAGCSDMGYADCTTNKFYMNFTAKAVDNCAYKYGDVYNISSSCQAGNITMKCESVDGTTSAEVTLYPGDACNGTGLGLGIFKADTCTYQSGGVYGKSFTNATGSYVASYSAAGCASSTQTNLLSLGVVSTTEGCVKGSLAAGYKSAFWKTLEVAAPTSAPASGNNTNTTAPKSSGVIVTASLASAVVAAAALML